MTIHGHLTFREFVLAIEIGEIIKMQITGHAGLICVPEQQIKNWETQGFVEYIGFHTDMVKVVKESNVIVLPSYREGLPKSLIEACAIGRAIVTTDVTGCRDVVTEGVNGFIVPAKNHQALAEAMEKLLLDKELRVKMGKKGREIAEKEFSIEGVIDKTFEIYCINGRN